MIKSIMIQGTGSSVGKSIITAAFCRIFLQDGYRTCPFKAQNMSLNSFVTKEGGEMGRAQVVQAQASGIAPHTDMNPILIKPTGDTKAQIIVCGKPVGNMHAVKYHGYKKIALKKALAAFHRLKNKYDIMVIEGAGSPAEVNLKKHDIVNMKIARATGSPVILVGDIDRGGVFASLVGTLELLSRNERNRVKGFIINKFRGDKRLLQDGLTFLKRKTGKTVLGVIPYFKEIIIPEEDSVALENRMSAKVKRKSEGKKIKIAVIKLPYISNFTDFDALENEPDVRLKYVNDESGLDGANLIIIPGTKNTIKDLLWLRESGMAQGLLSRIKNNPSAVLLGICGGYQMLGKAIYDRANIESDETEIAGLGLLPMVTEFKPEKILAQTEVIEIKTGIELKGYEIHHGRTLYSGKAQPLFKVKGKSRMDGMYRRDGSVYGAYLHGIFDNSAFRRSFLDNTRKRMGLKQFSGGISGGNPEENFDKLAKLVRNSLDMKLLYKILGA